VDLGDEEAENACTHCLDPAECPHCAVVDVRGK
jgi:hypothetical protein